MEVRGIVFLKFYRGGFGCVVKFIGNKFCLEVLYLFVVVLIDDNGLFFLLLISFNFDVGSWHELNGFDTSS
jgi:hypothetical protein